MRTMLPHQRPHVNAQKVNLMDLSSGMALKVALNLCQWSRDGTRTLQSSLGEVGEYCGLFGEYCGLVMDARRAGLRGEALYMGLVGEYDGLVGDVGLVGL